MKRLTRIIFVNWYLFAAKQWEVTGHVALIGKNGSGKSSFIDAMQYVLLGGHKTDWHPNAKASETRRTRDVRSYVLGLVKDESAISDAGSSFQPREQALCRLVLVFEDEDSGELTSVGAAISARRNDPKEEVEGFFILKGLGLTLDDVTSRTEQGRIEKSYAMMTADFRRRLPDEQRFLFKHEPGQFVEQLLRSLGPANRPPALAKYKRSFKQSINLSGLDDSVSEFVKHSILDAQPLNLEQMRQSIASYRNKLDAVKRAQDQVKALEQIHESFQRAVKAGQRRAGYQWCAQELRFQGHQDLIDRLEQNLADTVLKYRKLREARGELQQQLLQQRAALEELTTTINNNDSEINLKRLQEREQMEQQNLQRGEQQLQELRRQLSIVTEVLRYREVLPAASHPALQRLADDTRDGLLDWPMEPAPFDARIDTLRERLPDDITQLDDRHHHEKHEAAQSRDRLGEVQERLTRLRDGQADLSPATLGLQQALAEHGIEATPVCDLVEVSDKNWQPAIEAFLRQNTEALVVPPTKAKQAVDIYRGMRKSIAYGAVVINTQRVQDWRDKPEAGTAAALIRGSDPLATAYVQRLLKGIRLAEVTSEFMGLERALTPDGMYIRQAGISRLRLPEVPKLGQGAREEQIKALELETSTLITRLTELNASHGKLERVLTQLRDLHHDVKKMPATAPLIKERVGLRRVIQDLQASIAAVDTRHLADLKVKQQTLKTAVQDADQRLVKYVREEGGARTEFRGNNRQRHVLMAHTPELGAARTRAAKDDDFEAGRASELLEQLETEAAAKAQQSFEDMIKVADHKAHDAETHQSADNTRAREALAEYRATYQSEGSAFDAHTTAGFRTLVAEMLHDIRDIGLHKRQQDVADALHRVQQVVRHDLAIRLRSQIEQMRQRLHELNTELKARPFSANQIYQFSYEQLNEFREFLSYVNVVNDTVAANTGSLFDEHAHLNQYIEAMLSENEGDRLGDYRNYFRFDIAIKDPDAGITEMLSRRMGAASGGEHKTPFYVAMGASLASAFRIERRGDGSLDGGLSLYLADEAFEKMDHVNTVQAAGYLKSIGLQLFVAAPDDAEPKLRQLVDTVLYFMREGNTAEVEVDYVTDAARRLLEQSARHPDLAPELA